MLISGFSLANNIMISTGTCIENTGTIKVAETILDDLYASNDIQDDFTDGVPEWNDSTILKAEYLVDENHPEGCYEGSNIDRLNDITELRLKRRKSEADPWTVVFVKYINEASDFAFQFKDFYNKSKTKYQYILIPVINGEESEHLLGNASNFVQSEFEGVFLADKDSIWGTHANVTYSRQRVRQTNVVTTLASKYPTVISNAAINYETGDVSGLFVEYTNGEFDFDNGTTYRNSFYDFLSNGTPKIMKTGDGLIKMIEVTSDISEDDSNTLLPTTSFSWTEIGDPESYDDLYDNNFIEYDDKVDGINVYYN